MPQASGKNNISHIAVYPKPLRTNEHLSALAGMYGFFFVDGEVKNFEEAAKQDTAKFGRWHRGMLEHGIYLAPSAYEAGFTSLAHTEEDIDKTIAAAREVMQSI